MAFSVGVLSAEVTADTGDFDQAMRQVKRKGERTAQSVSESFSQIGQNLLGVGAGLSAALTVPIALAGGAALKSAAKFESLKVQLEVLTGSAQEGAQAFNLLTDYATRTPFALQDVVRAGKRLITVLGDVDLANEVLRDLGDIAAIANVPLSDMSTILAQIQTKGQAMTEELRQFGERGVPIFEILANSMNISKQAVQELVTAGKVGFADVAEAIDFATSKQGMFAQGAIKASKTLTGIWSNLTGAIEVAASQIGQAIASAFNLRNLGNALITKISEITAAFTALSPEVKRVSLAIVALIGASGPIIAALGALSLAIGAISAPLVGVVAAFTAASVAIVRNWDSIVRYFTTGDGAQMWDSIVSMASEAFDTIKELVDTLVRLISIAWSKWGETFIKITNAVIGSTAAIFGGLANALSAVLNLMQQDWKGFWIDIVESAASILSVLQPAIAANLSMHIAVMEQKEFSNSAKATQQAVQAALTKTKTKIDDIAKAYKGVSGKTVSVGVSGSNQPNPFLGMANPVKTANVAIQGLNSTLNLTGGVLSKVGVKFAGISEIFNKTKSNAVQMGQALQTTVSSAITSFATTLGNAFTGDAGASGFFNNILLIVADFGKQLGRMLIAAGIAAQAFKSLLLNPFAAIAAGTALIAASTAVSNLLKKGPAGKFHSGGIVGGTGDQMILAKGGEGVFTRDQMRALGLMVNRPRGGGSTYVEIGLPDIYLDGQKVYENQQNVKTILDR